MEFQCGVVLIEAGAQDDEHVDGLVDFITSVFDARPELYSTLEPVLPSPSPFKVTETAKKLGFSVIWQPAIEYRPVPNCLISGVWWPFAP